jgi:serine protease Do
MKTSFISSLRHRPLAAAGAVAAVALAAFLPLTGKEAPQMKFDDTTLSHDERPVVSFAPVIKRVGPSVVNIYSTKTIRQEMSPMLADPLFREFFGGGMQNIPRERREQSLGSGVIVSADGYILTNNHVVANADEVKVGLSDNQTVYDAKVIGTDPQTDIAVLKVEAKEMPAITLTDSDKVEVGDVVLAIGNPFGIGQTVTMGIVSAKGRGGMGIVDYEDFLQTDASINPGNSGGALVDAAGRLVGINTAILSRTGGNQGVGFAVPANLARFVLERIVDGGKVNRGHLGVLVQPMTPELAKKFDLPQNTGALVGDVTSNSPAEKAGIKAGDVLVEFNGRKIADSRQLRLMAGQSSPGTEVSVKLLRDGKEETVKVTLG